MWKSVRITKEGIGISHLFFSHDVLLFCQASKVQIQMVTNTLQDFCDASGMKVNLDKSRMFCSTNVDQRRQHELSAISGISRTSNLGKYLGLPLLKGRVTKENFSPITNKVNTRLASWKGRLLNKACKLCLARSV